MTTSYREDLVDVGLAWIGEVPQAWNVRRLGHFFDERREKVSDKDFSPLSVTMKGVVPQLENVAKTDDGDNRKLVRSGDFVINSRSDRKGSGGVAPQDGSVSLINTVLEPQAGMSIRFASYLLTSYPFQEEFYRVGNGIVADMWTTKYSEMKNIRLAVPDYGEQQAIASHLDRATTRIDALVAKKTRFIELLREKRQALITHAVTKGLDRGVPMKDSGVEWLGEVPVTWTPTKVCFLAQKIGSGKTPSGGAKVYADVGIPFLRSQNIYDDSIRLDDVAYITSDIHGEMGISQVRPWDVLLNITGGSIGRAALVPGTFGEANVNQHVCIVRVANPTLARWVHMCFRAQSTKEQIDALQSGANREGLNFEQVGNLRLALPPNQQIERTLEYLDKRIEQIDTLITKTECSIELLREHRTALITAAVTGKIDLRPSA